MKLALGLEDNVSPAGPVLVFVLESVGIIMSGHRVREKDAYLHVSQFGDDVDSLCREWHGGPHPNIMSCLPRKRLRLRLHLRLIFRA